MADTTGASKVLAKNLSIVYWGLLVFFVLKIAFPSVLSEIVALRVVGSIMCWIYYISQSLVLVLGIPSVVLLYFVTYSNKFDGKANINYNPSEKTPLWKTIIAYAKSIALIVLSAQTGYIAICVFAFLGLFLGFSIKFLQKDLIAKMAVLALSSGSANNMGESETQSSL